MNERYLILAAGKQERWLHEHDGKLPLFKQLVMVEGEMLIKRIQRQFPESIVVTNDKEIMEHSEQYFSPTDTRATICTLQSTVFLWKEWTTILLGDVNYGQLTIELIKRQRDPLMFYGNEEEIFAMRFHYMQTLNITKAIHSLLSDKDWTPDFGRLWYLYRVLRGIDYRVHEIKDYFTFVDDCVDYDNCKQYYKWYQ